MTKNINLIEDRAEIHSRLKGIIEHHIKMQSCYFLDPPKTSQGRRDYEENYSDAYCFLYNDNSIKVIQQVKCSCKNIYYNMHVYLGDDPENKTVRLLKKVLGEYPPILVSKGAKFKYDFTSRNFSTSKPGITIDLRNQNDLILQVAGNTIVYNPGDNVRLYRKDLQLDKFTKLINNITYITNNNGIEGFSNQEEIDSYLFDNNI